ncbi:MAG: thiamine phosphate synthase [Verrucomicrobiales bacterium]|nr:thiamine phosphate synthase [Verrucomicrobiales bacterium]
MRSKLLPARLYGILDLGYTEPENLEFTAKQMIAGGIDVLQLRAKNCSLENIEKWAKQILPLCRDGDVPFFINDHPEIAVSVGTDGVHVGQDDLTMDEVRAVTGDEMLVGRSTHSVEQAAAAAADPRTDCIGFGPLFATPTKPDYTPIGTREIQAVHTAHPGLPIFCIGGIKKENLPEVIAAGARRVVIVSGIRQAPDIEKYVNQSKELIAKLLETSSVPADTN